MQIEPVKPEVPRGGLSQLRDVTLSPSRQEMLNLATARNSGSGVWPQRKKAEARDLLALEQIAPRLRIDYLDLTASLRAVLVLRVPVPCLVDPSGELFVGDRVVLGLTYPEEAMRVALPGPSFIQILDPQLVWHANVGYGPVQLLCLGAHVPAGTRVKELVLSAYGALSMQTVQVDERDTAGVMNAKAAVWWQSNMHRVPLSKEAFLA